MKHPLNKKSEIGFHEKEIEWIPEYGVYGHIKNDETGKIYYPQYFIGDRQIYLSGTRWVKIELDRFIYERGKIDLKEDALEWLRQANHKEYGSRLWEKDRII